MRAGPQLGVAKAARAPPCTLPILGRRFFTALELSFPRRRESPYIPIRNCNYRGINIYS